jgi:predicted nucleic acid-binding protein
VSFVLDSSVALTWCFEDERTPATEALLKRVVETGAIVPVLWPLEVLNALAMAERRKRVDRDTRHRLAGLLRELPIRVDIDSAAMAWTDTAALAERHQLTLYDASYLEVARRLALPLGTLDGALRKAADSIRVPLLGIEA